MMPGKKADKQSSREGVEILLGIESTAEPLEAIELAINGAGGEITGRAYSNGHDILYTRINAAAVYDLVKRLGRIGKILELPQIPEEAAGSIDLLVRW